MSSTTLGRRRRHGGADGEESYFISMTDMMVGLVFVLIVMLVYFAMQFHRTTQELTDANTRRTELLKQVQTKLRAENVEVTIDLNSGVLRLPEATLFAKGSAVVTPAGQAVLAKIGATLQAELPCYTSPGAVPASCPATKSGLESVFIEGHSDSDRMVGDRDNWNLSTDRAVNTYRSLIGSTPALENIKDARVRPNDPQPVFGVSGYGPSRPLVPETSEAAKARNRRIDIRFLMATPAAAAH